MQRRSCWLRPRAEPTHRMHQVQQVQVRVQRPRHPPAQRQPVPRREGCRPVIRSSSLPPSSPSPRRRSWPRPACTPERSSTAGRSNTTSRSTTARPCLPERAKPSSSSSRFPRKVSATGARSRVTRTQGWPESSTRQHRPQRPRRPQHPWKATAPSATQRQRSKPIPTHPPTNTAIRGRLLEARARASR